MCTLTFAWQAFEDAYLVVAANRDERSDRPSLPPDRRGWGRPVVAPKDSEADGTWIGYNDEGVFVAITNRWIEGGEPGDRSRGLLVRDALGHASAEAAVRAVERELDERSYDGFNLVCADERAAILVEYDGNPHIRNLEPGVHVVVNVGADGDYALPPGRTDRGRTQAENADALQTELQPRPGEDSEGWLERASDVIADHEFGVCIHGDGFGTRSSSLVRLTGDDASYWFAHDSPCRTAYEPVLATTDE